MIGNGISGCSTNQFSPEAQTAVHHQYLNSHGATQRGRIAQLLDVVKFEFEVLMQQVNLFRTQRNEFERIFASQVAELNTLRQAIQDMENNNQRMKKPYEDGLSRRCRNSEGYEPVVLDDLDNQFSSSSLITQGARSICSSFSNSRTPMNIKNRLSNGYYSESGVMYPRTHASGCGSSHKDQSSNCKYSDQILPSRFPRLDNPIPSSCMSSHTPSTPSRFKSLSYTKRHSSIYSRHMCQDPEVHQSVKKAQRMENEKRSVREGEQQIVDDNREPDNGSSENEQQIKKDGCDYKKLQHNRLQLQPYNKQGISKSVSVKKNSNISAQDADVEPLSRTWTKENVSFTVIYDNKCDSVKSPLLKIELIHNLNPESVVCCVKFSDDGKMLAVGCNHAAHIYDVSTGSRIATLSNDRVKKDGDLYVRSLCFSPDAKYIATGAEDYVIRVWDIQRMKIRWSFNYHEQDVYSLDWFKDKNFLVSGSGDKTIRIWDIDQGVCTLNWVNDDSKFIRNSKSLINRHKESNVTSVAVNPVYFNCIATGSLDGIVRLWDITTVGLLERFEGHMNSVYSISFSPNGKSLVSGSLDKTVKVWDISPRIISCLEKISPKSSSASKQKLQEPPEPVINQSPRRSFVGHTDFVLSVAFAEQNFIPRAVNEQQDDSNSRQDDYFDMEWIISGSKDCSVMFWGLPLNSANSRQDRSRRQQNCQSSYKLALRGHENSVISVDLASRGIFATGSGDSHARVWKISAVYDQKQNAFSNTSVDHNCSPQDKPQISSALNHSSIDSSRISNDSNLRINYSSVSPCPRVSDGGLKEDSGSKPLRNNIHSIEDSNVP